jgi:hypothetical protein
MVKIMRFFQFFLCKVIPFLFLKIFDSRILIFDLRNSFNLIIKDRAERYNKSEI